MPHKISSPPYLSSRSSADRRGATEAAVRKGKSVDLISCAPRAPHQATDGGARRPPATPEMVICPPKKTLSCVKVSNGKVAAGELSQRFAVALDELLWRPKGSGRHHVQPWLKALLLQALRDSKGRLPALRNVYAELLRNEDLGHPRHMSQVAPSDHLRSPWAYRVWPDKVQALVTLDRLTRPTALPAAVREGLWQPVGLHTPRFTVVEINPAMAGSKAAVVSGGWALHFAETPTVLVVASLSDPQRRGAKDSQLAAAVLSQLEGVRQVFADPVSFFNDILGPLLRATPGAPAEALPVFGLCTRALLARRPVAEGADACIRWLRTIVAKEQRELRDYIDTIRFGFRPDLADALAGHVPRHWPDASS